MMGTRVLSLWLPYLAIDRRRDKGARSRPGRSGLPMATCRQDIESAPLVALCPKAEHAGLQQGMTSAEARKRIPGLEIHADDPEADAESLVEAISWCERYTPFVAVDRRAAGQKGAALWLDIGASAHLAGGEAGLLADLLGRFQRIGLTAKAAIADHPGSAWAACRFGSDEQRILPTNGARVALAPWPLEALRLETADCEKLESAGIDRIEHLYALPRRAIAARFGDHVATRLDQALGLVDEPIARDTPLPAQQAQMIFADPITDHTALPALVDRLLHQLCIGLKAAGLGARRLTLALYRVDNSTVTCTIGSDRPTCDRQQLAAMFADRSEKIDLGFGLERAILDAVEIEPLLPENIHWRGLGTPPARQERDFWQQRSGNDSAAGPETLSFPPRPAHRAAALPVTYGRTATALLLEPEEVERPALRETLPRPLRLLRQPEPIEAVAPLPDEPPVLFRWRQGLHKVISAKGPETVAPDWWCSPSTEKPRGPTEDDPGARDYFAVEDSEGARFWLFRDGRYEAASMTMPRWFLHGLFG